MAPHSNVVTVVTKLLGGRAVAKELEHVGKAGHKAGEEFKKGEHAAGSGHGWELFTKKSEKARKENEKHTRSLHGMAGGAVKYAAGAAGIYGAVGLAKSSITDLGTTAEEMRQAGGLGLGMNRETLLTLESYKQRDIGIKQLGMSMKSIAKAQYSAAAQEAAQQKKIGASGVSRAREVERYEKAVQKAKENGTALPSPLGAPKETAELGSKAKAFATLGINVANFRKLSGSDQLKALSAALTNMPAGPERTRIATELLGKSAQKMLPLFTKGALGIQAMEKSAKEFIPNLKGGEKGFEEMEAGQLRLGLATEGLKLRIGMALLPIVVKLMGTFTKLYDNMSHGRGVWKDVGHYAATFAGVLKSVWMWIKHNEGAQKALIGVLALLAAAWAIEKVVSFVKWIRELWVVGKAMWLLTKLWTAAQIAWDVAVFVGLAPVLLLVAGVALLALGAYMLIKHWKAVKNFFIGVFGWMKAHWKLLAQIILTPIMGPIVLIVFHWKLLLHFFESLPKKFLKVASAIGKGIWEGIKWGLNKVIEGLEWVIHQIGIPGFHVGPIHFGGIHPLGGVHLPHLAEGGTVMKGGSAIVGEHGPEWLNLPSGAQVRPLQRAGGHTAFPGTYHNGAGGDMVISVQLDRKEVGRAVLKQLNAEQARMP